MSRWLMLAGAIALIESVALFLLGRCCRGRRIWKWYLALHVPWWTGLVLIWARSWVRWPWHLGDVWLGWGWALLMGKMLLGMVGLGGRVVRLVGREAKEDRPPHPSRRRFLMRSAEVAMAAPLTMTGAAALATPHMLKVRRRTFEFAALPSAFDGLRIVHLSDLHLGTFRGETPVRRIVAAVQAQRPDVVFFTGDLVNHRAEEAERFLLLLRGIRAPMGVYAVLGNHDYGYYYPWKDARAHRQNFRRLLSLFPAMGWQLLRNEHVLLEKDGQLLAVVGLENWNRHGRIQRADYARAVEGLRPDTFQILLAHDPHYFEDFIWKKQRVHLTLSGHTHGFQMGVELGRWRWSPAQYMYRFWADAYRWDDQALYVSRGAGMVGLPFRMGIWPEVTVVIVRKKMSKLAR